MRKFYVFIDRTTFPFPGHFGAKYWKEFSSELGARLYAKINGYKLIARGK